MKLSVYGNTNIGRQRDHNEDSYLIFCNIDNNWQVVNNMEIDSSKLKGALFVVADGMGGTNAGEVASDIAVTTVRERISKITSLPEDTTEIQKMLNSIVLEGHNKILKASRHNNVMQGMGTTIVMGYFSNETLYVAWSGDSRCYVYNKNCDKELLPFTDDHSLVWERVINKEITPEEARISEDSNLILQSLGGSPLRPEPDFKWVKLKNNDRILFCSDGLNSMLSNLGIQQILDFHSSPLETCDSLILAANNAGGRDNITAIVIDITDDNETIKESPEPTIKKEAKRKKPYILFILLIIIICIAAGFYFRSEITKVFLYKFARDTSLIIQEPDLNDSLRLIEGNSGSDLKPYKSFVEDDSLQKTVQKVKNTPVISNIKVGIDSVNIEIKIREAVNKILSIKKSINMVKPGGAIYNPTFYDENKTKLDSILSKLAVQEKLIESIGILNSNDYLVKISDYGKANNVYKKIGENLTELEKRTNVVIDR